MARPEAAAAGCDQRASGSGVEEARDLQEPAAVLESHVGAQHEGRELRDERVRQLAMEHEQHVVAVRREPQRREHAALAIAGCRQHSGMALEPQQVVRELALEEAARIAAHDSDDSQVG